MIKLQEVIIKENEDIIIDKHGKIYKYLIREFSNPLKFKNYDKHIVISNKNLIGILKFRDIIYKIIPKTKEFFNIFRMMEKISCCQYIFKNNMNYIYFDPKVSINLKEGINFNNQIINIFLYELVRIKSIGYSKKYENICENIFYIKGKLNINKQITKNIIPNKFMCNYNRLTYITQENIIIYKTINTILMEYSINKEQKKNLIKFKNEFEILLEGAKKVLFFKDKNINYIPTRINRHYNNIIKICYMILKKRYSSSLKDGESIFCNFLVRTDIVYERYLFILIKQIIEEEYSQLYIDEQVIINSIKKLDNTTFKESKGYLEMKPDIVIYNKEDNKPIMIIDTKYIDISNKNKLSNSAYYQVMSYMIGMMKYGKGNLVSILLAYGNRGNSYKINLDKECDFYIHTEGIDIFAKEKELILQLKTILKKYIKI